MKRSYELRSRISPLDLLNEWVSTGGLAFNSSQKPILGRKTSLSKAQVYDAIDVKQGKHTTLKWALRFLALDGGP